MCSSDLSLSPFFISLHLSLPLSISLHLSLPLSISLHLSLPLSISPSLIFPSPAHTLNFPLCFLYFCLTIFPPFISLSLSPSLSPSLPLSLPLSPPPAWSQVGDQCVVQTTSWSQCSRSCGMGVSSRLTNDNRQCKPEKESRLCNIRPCSSLAPPARVEGGGEGREAVCQRGHIDINIIKFILVSSRPLSSLPLT